MRERAREEKMEIVRYRIASLWRPPSDAPQTPPPILIEVRIRALNQRCCAQPESLRYR